MSEECNTEARFWSKTSLIQIGYGVWVSLTNMTIGLAFGFPAVTIPQLMGESSINIETKHEAWITSVITLFAPVGCIISAFVMDKYGRKVIIIICEVPLFIGWFYTMTAKTTMQIIIGRAITGVGCGMAMGAPKAYITEITLPSMRGVIGVFPHLSLSMGLTIQALLGSFFEWRVLCIICGTFSGILCCVNFFLKETPYYVLLRGTEQDAIKSLKNFRSKKYNIDAEVDDLMEFKMNNDIHKLTVIGQLKFLMTKGACKPFWIILIYLAFTQLTGVTIIIMWSINILEGTSSSVNPNIGNTITGLTRVISGVACSALMYKIGRKPQALISSVGVGVVCLVFGSVSHANYQFSPSEFPIVCFILYTMFATLGYYILPFLMMYELYPLQLRGLLGGITVSLFNLMVFGVNYAFPYVRDAIGHAIIFILFGVFSFLASVYLYFYLPETKNLTLQEIEEYFNERRPTLVSQSHVIAAQRRGHTMSGLSLKHASKSHTSLKDQGHGASSLQIKKKKKYETDEKSTVRIEESSSADKDKNNTDINEEKKK